jgi:hypothetical protein
MKALHAAAITSLIILTTFGLVSCSKYTALTEASKASYENNDYQAAYSELHSNIKSDEAAGKAVKPSAYMWAGKAAYQLQEFEVALNYLEKSYKQIIYDEESLMLLAELYKKIDNLSKEINVLEFYNAKYPNGKLEDEMNGKRFLAYVESENWDYAIGMVDSLSNESNSALEIQEAQIKMFDFYDKHIEATKLAKSVLQLDKKNETALYYLAKKFYWKAENKYDAEMEKYEKKKTRSQYNKLLKELKLISADFRTSRDYFLKLYKAHPKPEYAKYLGNIYARLNDKEKSNYYKKRSK